MISVEDSRRVGVFNGPLKSKHTTAATCLSCLSPTMAGMGMMMRADANRDGILTRAEATTAAQAAFDRIDTNRDGRVDQAERDAARQQMKMRRGGDSAATGGVSR